MVARSALPEAVLAELGYLTIAYSGLEEHLITMIAALLSPADQAPSRDVASRMGFRDKIDTLSRLFALRCGQVALDPADSMKRALAICSNAGAARNELVHGLADYDEG